MSSEEQPALVAPWLWWTGAAAIATILHVLIDLHLGLFGPQSTDMSLNKGAWALSQAAVLGWWMLVIGAAARGSTPAMKANLLLVGLIAALFNGLVAVVAAPPVSDAAPWQDIAHFGAVIAGIGAVWTTRTALRSMPSAPGGWVLWSTVGLVIVNMALAAPLNLDAVS